MRNFKTFTEAVEAAERFFKETFNHSGNVGYSQHEINRDGSEFLEFYSKDDPAMEDTFKVTIQP